MARHNLVTVAELKEIAEQRGFVWRGMADPDAYGHRYVNIKCPTCFETHTILAHRLLKWKCACRQSHVRRYKDVPMPKGKTLLGVEGRYAKVRCDKCGLERFVLRCDAVTSPCPTCTGRRKGFSGGMPAGLIVAQDTDGRVWCWRSNWPDDKIALEKSRRHLLRYWRMDGLGWKLNPLYDEARRLSHSYDATLKYAKEYGNGAAWLHLNGREEFLL